MNKTLEPVCIPLKKIENQPVGGKASGLSKLMSFGLTVPDGFVIFNAKPGILPGNLKSAYESIGSGFVAVRSSALDEDGGTVSHAGQYDTILHVEGIESLEKAVEQCLLSVSGKLSQEYNKTFESDETSVMAVVVQKMIMAAKAGVVFTADPVSSKKEHIVINAINGEGEDLVSGNETADQYILNRKGDTVENVIQNSIPVLTSGEIDAILEGALKAEDKFNIPLDLEWAIDSAGTIHWLQARPITTIDDVTIDELDSPVESEDHIFTRCNVSEMLPGAVTPLSISIFAEAIDYGMKDMYIEAGVARNQKEMKQLIFSFSNHLFMNFSNMYSIVDAVAGSSKEGIELSILGQVLEGHDVRPRKNSLIRILNGFRYFRYIGKCKRRMKEIKKVADTFEIQLENVSAEELYHAIDVNIPLLNRQYINHYTASAYSGAMNGVLISMISERKTPTVDHHEKAASLLIDIENIESADVVKSLDLICKEMAADKMGAEEFIKLEDTNALKWLEANKDGAGKLFFNFLEQHGHRCIREAELRAVDWGSNPLGLIKTLQSMIKASLHSDTVIREQKAKGSEIPDHIAGKSSFQWALKKAREGVHNREYTKSLVIKVQNQFKHAYRQLGEILEDKNILPEMDLVYFLSHQELGSLILENDKSQVMKAIKRKRIFPEQVKLQFPETVTGKPKPLKRETYDLNDSDVLKGIPVSRGNAEGKVRIVLNQEDAENLEAGEIMVAQYTDVGWTPYYSLAAGLITEIGSALSHGAVVAREYGLPMVVNIQNATGILKDGDMISLDAYEGTVQKIS